MKLIDEENYFDQYEALHTVCSLYHDGMNSLKYSILSQSEFKPSPSWRETEVIKNNPFYEEIAGYSDDEIRQLFQELTEYLDRKED